MADIQSNIRVNIDTSEALANIKALQREISAFHVAMGKGGAAAAAQSAAMRQSLINGINSSGKFSASFQTISSSAETFTKALEKNKLALGEYFRYAGGASKSFGKYFKTEMNTIEKVAVERVKTLQTQYIKMGRDASGALKAIAVRPLALDMKNLGTQTALAAQKQQLLNQLLKQGSTNLLNFGKNTQWAGRQLMVGFTIPLATLGMAATKTFKQMEEQAIKFRRVYGDTFTASSETDAMLKQIQDLASEFTKYGVAMSDTMNMAANAAAAGKQGADLLAQVADATRLAVLGNVEQNKALETTISLTNAFGTATKDLRGEVNFLNAVENQTVTSIEDLTTAIPKAAPVIKQLGGDVKDLAFFLTAMREGGINASEGANALKSGLASLINPTTKATKMLSGFGIDLAGMVEKDKGDVSKLIVDFAKALDTLDPLSRSRAIEQMFGKFQFARMSTLFQNVIKEGSQASRVLEIMGQGTAQLGILAQKELKKIESSPLYKFQKAIEDFKKQLAPVGEEFMKAITPLINFGTDLLNNFNKLEPGVKQFVVGITGIVAGLGPVLLMTFGLIANGIANLIKGFAFVKNVFNRTTSSSQVLGETTHYMTEEQLRAAAVAASLEQTHAKLAQAFTVERTALEALTATYRKATSAQQAFGTVPGSVAKKTPKKKYARGTFSVPGPKGAGDIVPAMLSPGEAVIPAQQASLHRSLIVDIINGNLPGYKMGSPAIGMASGGYVSEAQKAFKAAQQAKIEEVRKKNLAANQNKNFKSRPEALFVNQSLIEKLGLTGDSPISKAIAASAFTKKLFIGNNTGTWSEFRSSPAFSVLREAGLRENRYETVPSTSFRELMKKYKMSTYNASGALVQYFNAGTESVIDPKTGKPRKVKKERRARNTSSVQGVLNMLRSHTGGKPRSWNSRLPKFEWEGMEQEISAGLQAAEQHMRSQGLPDSKISRNLNNLKTVQLSHLKPESKMFDVAGRQRNLKIWRTGNVIPDSGIYNQYLKEIGDKKGFFDKIDPKQIAATSGMSESSVKKSIAKFKAGEHPTTPGEYSALAAIGKQDTGSYAGAAASAAFKASNGRKGFFKSKAAGAFKLDPSLDALAEKDLNNLVNRATANIEKLEGKAQSVVDAEVKTSKKREATNKKNTKAVEKNTAEVKKTTKATRKVFTHEERLAAATEKVTKAREAIANPNNRKKTFNKSEIAANNLLLYGNPNGPTGDQRQTRKDALAAAKAERVALAQQRQAARPSARKPGRFGGLSGKIMAGSMAASMAGGMIGGDAGSLLSNVGSAVFTASMFKDLFAGAGKKLGGTKVGISATKAFAPMLEGLITVGPKLIKFGGPIMLAIGAVELFTSVLLEDARKRAEVDKAIADMLDTSKEKLDSLNSFFGTDAQVSGVRRGKTISPDQTRKEASLTSQFIQSDEFKTNYADIASKLKGATTEQLSLALKSLAIDLVGSGIGEEQAQIIIDAIKTEAGKKDLVIEVKSLRLNTKAGQESFKQSIDEVLKSMQNTFFASNEFKIGDFIKDPNWFKDTFAVVIGSDLEGAKKNISELASLVNGLGGQLQNGIITTDQYEKSWKAITDAVNSLPEDIKADTWSAVIADLNPEMYDLVKNLKMVDQQLVVGALAYGLDIPQQVFDGLNSADEKIQSIARGILEIAKANAKENYEKVTKIKQKLKAQENSIDALKDKEDAINKKYDERLDILDQIIAANDVISQQQKSQLDIADALTQGDVAAAAKAMQQARQDNAAYALEQQSSALEQARTNELKPVQAAIKSGDTVTQNIQDSLNTTIENFNAYKDVDMSKLETGNKDLGYDPANFFDYNNPNGIFAPLYAMGILTDFSKKATGGYISGKGTGTSDSIPAMLSNGEYVIRAKAAQAIGVDTLDKMNHAEKFAMGGPINVAKYATGGLVGRYANGGYASADERRASLNRKVFADDRRSSLNTNKKDSNPIANWARDNAEWAKWVPGLNGLVQATAMGDAFNSKSPSTSDAARDAKYKKGGFEGFEAGFQGMMADMGTNPFIKAIGAGISSNPYTDFTMSTLSLPVNMLGTTVNNAMKGISAGMDVFSNKDSAFNQVMSGKMNYFEGIGKTFSDMVPAGLAMLGNQFADPFVSTYGHIVDKQTDFKGGFDKATDTVIANKWFGTDTEEGAARARVVGGFLDVFGDPTNYIPGAGIAASTAGKAGKFSSMASKISKVTSKIKPALKKIPKPYKTPNISKIVKMNPAQQQKMFAREYSGMKLSGIDGKKYSVTDVRVSNIDNAGRQLPPNTSIVSGSFRDENGAVVGIFNREVSSDHIKHDLLTMSTPGTGLGSDFGKKSEAMYQRMGIDRIDVNAGLTHGGYAWAKAGYNFKTEPTGLVDKINRYAELLPNNYGLSDLAHRFSTLRLGETGYPTPQEILGISDKLSEPSFNILRDNTYSVSELSKYIRPGDTLGRAILMGSGWSGIKFLGKDAGKKYSNFLKHNAPKPPTVSYTTKPGSNGMYDETGAVYANGGLVKPKYFAKGGMVGHYAKGGDVVPSMLTPGEFVVNQPAVKKFGAGNLQSINNGSFGGGKNVNVSNNGTNSANSVYNSYSVNINVSGESANPEALAKVVLKEIKKVSSQGIRGV